MSERKYLPTSGELSDLLCISLMKSVFIERASYRAKMALIMDDLRSYFNKVPLTPEGHVQFAYALAVLMLSDRYIWENEAITRKTGKGGRLRVTHSINGVRNRAKNEINKLFGDPVDEKIDCLAADLPLDMGNWRVFD
jgi:hypothetical protein